MEINSSNNDKLNMEPAEDQNKLIDYTPRALWLRAIVLGGHEGLASAALMMMGVGIISDDNKAILITSFSGLVVGALSLAIVEFVSVYTQVDVMTFQFKRNQRMGRSGGRGLVPSPIVVAVAASVTYMIGGSLIIIIAVFLKDEKLRSFVGMIVASLSLVVVGIIGAWLGKTPTARSCARLLFGGWIMIFILWGKNYFLLSLCLWRSSNTL